MSLLFKDVSRRILKEEKPQSNINLERAQRKRNDRIINASLLIRTWIRHWGLLSLNANVQWKRPCTMPSGILFDVVSRYPPGFLCVPVDLYTGLPTRLLISMDASPEPSHSSVEKGDGEGGKSRLDVGRTFILYLYRSPVCFIVLANKSLREKLFHLTESPEEGCRILWNGTIHTRENARWVELYCFHFATRQFWTNSTSIRIFFQLCIAFLLVVNNWTHVHSLDRLASSFFEVRFTCHHRDKWVWL